MSAMRACLCCGYKTISSKGADYHICPICYWEDDPIAYGDPNFAGGANKVSLNQAKANFAAFGASQERFKDYVREPSKRDGR
jgi:hypothetical protein